MFLVSAGKGKDKKDFVEGSKFIDEKKQERGFTWDDIPKEVKISSLQLLYPFPVKFKKAGGGLPEEITPKLTMSGFNRYYFFNEATMPVMVQGEKVVREGIPELQAKTIAGIDDKAKMIIELRMDKWGNSTIKKFQLKDLEKSIKDGLFRNEIIRRGN